MDRIGRISALNAEQPRGKPKPNSSTRTPARLVAKMPRLVHEHEQGQNDDEKKKKSCTIAFVFGHADLHVPAEPFCGEPPEMSRSVADETAERARFAGRF